MSAGFPRAEKNNRSHIGGAAAAPQPHGTSVWAVRGQTVGGRADVYPCFHARRQEPKNTISSGMCCQSMNAPSPEIMKIGKYNDGEPIIVL